MRGRERTPEDRLIEEVVGRVMGLRVRRVLRRALPPVPSCPKCGKHTDRDLPLADKCTCYPTTRGS